MIYYGERKLNIKRVILIVCAVATSICLSFSIFHITRDYKIFSLESKETKTFESMREEKKLEDEKAKQEEEKKRAKYLPLSADDIEKVYSAYKSPEDGSKRVFLTFDDGPTKSVTPYILDLLKQENIKANFFVLGSRVYYNKDIAKREFDEGHFIGNHSYSHNYDSIYASEESILDEYNRTNDILREATGCDYFNTLIFRFPGGTRGGKHNDLKVATAEKLHQMGVGTIDWNVLTGDAEGSRTKEAILEDFNKGVQGKNSVVLLMHDASDKILTYETLPDIISYFRNNGYQFMTFYDLLNR